jgi:hypothetical protein
MVLGIKAIVKRVCSIAWLFVFKKGLKAIEVGKAVTQMLLMRRLGGRRGVIYMPMPGSLLDLGKR